jgi:mannosylglycerate hydrolase
VSADTPTELRARALDVLESNHRAGYTVPAEGLYPYQWCWDSGPIALGWAAADRWDDAWAELRTLLSAQWPSGFVPHIVFWVDGGDYFPGPELWATGHDPPTTGITQPPLVLSAAARLFARDPDRARAHAALTALWPHLVAWVEWLDRSRRGPHGACVIVHPWESGMDNSPSWDAPLASVPSAGNVHLDRRDVATVAADHRPTDRDYRHYLGIVEALRSAGWETEDQVAVSPFSIEDVAFTAIAARGAADLAAIAAEVGEDPEAMEKRATGWCDGLSALWDDDAGWFRPHDVRTGASLEPLTAGGLVALWARAVDDARVERLLARLDEWSARGLAVATCDPSAPEFDPVRYWRGPVWVLVNWLVADGLVGAGHADRAEALRRTTHALVVKSGFSEYYDARTGEGIGGRAFSWSAALTLAWLLDEERSDAQPHGARNVKTQSTDTAEEAS